MILEKVKNASKIEAREPKFYLKDFMPIPKNTLTMLAAPGGTGKSYLSIQLAIRVVKELIDENNSYKVLLWLSEDPLFIIKDRIEKVFKRILPDFLPLKQQILEKIDVIGAEENTLYFNTLSQEELEEIGNEIVTNYNLIVLDPLIAFFEGEENNNSQARKFMNILNRFTQERLVSILLIHHFAKSKELENRTRGASAFVDAVRLLYTLNTKKIDEDRIHPTNRIVKVQKDNWGVRQLLNREEFEIEVLPYIVREVTSDEGY